MIQKLLANLMFLSLPVLTLVWAWNFPSAWRGKLWPAVLSSLGLVFWPLLLIMFLRYYPHTGANYGDIAAAYLGLAVSVVGIGLLVLSLLTALIGKVTRKSRESGK